MCALFFIKRGFPFVSVLDGGFAAAHTWLARDCDYLSLSEVLVDYDEETSLFADLEKSYQVSKEFSNASTRRKTTMAMQKLIDNSMVRLTNAENKVEEFTDRFISAKKESASQANANSSQEDTTDVETVGTSDSVTNINAAENQAGAPVDSKRIKATWAGIKNMRTNQKDNNSEPLTFDMGRISFGRNKEKKQEERNTQTQEKDSNEKPRFEFSKLSFARGSRSRNLFTKAKQKVSKEDEALEKEIEASLSPPLEDNTKAGTDPPKENTKKSGQDPEIKVNFKAAFKSNPFGKFNAFKKPNMPPKNQGAFREEEAILFDEDE